MKLSRKKPVDTEFERSVAEEPPHADDRNAIDRDRHYGGDPALDRKRDVDPAGEAREWERRYGTEESRDKLGFDGE
jgi:hypothetical protein